MPSASPDDNMLAQTTRSRPATLAAAARTRRAPVTEPADFAVGAAGPALLLHLPFDAMRIQYAGAVLAGLAQRSILASGRLERALDTLERLILGSLARQR